MVYKRLLDLPQNHSFFLFGPRGSGKSTLIEMWRAQLLKNSLRANEIFSLDLLDPKTEETYSQTPQLLKEQLLSPKSTIKWCLIDEIQKIPALLDVAHWAIQKKIVNFAMTGSSARKIKRGRGNLLAGRAFDFKLHPLTSIELKNDFNLERTLRFGSLPEIFSLGTEIDKNRFLEAYCRTYLREEIQLEQIVRNVQKFRRFLNFSSQMNARIMNFSKLSHASGVDDKSISRYFEILEDTLVGILLEPYDKSIRKRQTLKPKFYLFDTGITCTLREDFSGILKASSSFYGELFEQWFILECHRLKDYTENRDQYFYLNSKDNVEIDLIIEKRGLNPILVEIKSSDSITPHHTRHLKAFSKSIKHSRAIVVCREKQPRLTEDGIEIIPWDVALKELFF